MVNSIERPLLAASLVKENPLSIYDSRFTIYEHLPTYLTATVLGVLNSQVAKQQTKFFQKDEK